MHMRREVGEKGQVVLPKDIRDYLNIKPGTKVIFEVRGNEIVIKPEKSGKEFVDDFCNVPKLKKRLSVKGLKRLYEEQLEGRNRNVLHRR